MLEKVFGLVPTAVCFGLVGGVLGGGDAAVCLKDGEEDCMERPLVLAERREEGLLDRPPREACGVCRKELFIDERGRGEREGTLCFFKGGKGEGVVGLRRYLERTGRAVLDTERAEELGGLTAGCPIRLAPEVVWKGGLGRLTLGNEVVRSGLIGRNELDSVEDGVSILTDLTGDDVGVNFAYFTTCFDGNVVEGGAKERGGGGEALDEEGARDLTDGYEGGEGNANDWEDVEGVEGRANDLSAEECFLIKGNEDAAELGLA